MSATIDSDYIVEAMIKYGLVQLPTAEKWDEVKDAVLAAEPSLAQFSVFQLGRWWASARKKFTEATSSKSQLGVVDSTKIVTQLVEDPTKVVEKQLGVVAQPVTSPGAPVQVNVNIGSDSSKLVNPGIGGVGSQLGEVGGKLKGLPDQAMIVSKIAKGVEKVVNSMLKKNVSYLGLVAAASEIVGPEGKVLLEQVTRTILELHKQFYPVELIQMRVGREFGATFKELIGSYGKVVNGSGEVPKGWEKLKLPVILDTDTEKDSKTPPKEGSSTSQQLPPTTQPTSRHEDPFPFYSDLIPNFGYDEALECARRVALFSGGNLSQAASGVPRDERPFKQR
jgi:hypothetical protein